ncbi:MAG TPA: ATP-binding protein [Anaeromyxobacteraceae bacterium]|nr:ATP-binding protein [Anaeromyxobacteraceae bacterium]
MSLRARIVLVFATALLAALALAGHLGERYADRALERALGDRTLDMARSVAEELALTPATPSAEVADVIGDILDSRRSVRSAELAIRRTRREFDVLTWEPGQEDATVATTGPRELPARASVALLPGTSPRVWTAHVPVRTPDGRAFAELTLEASLPELEAIAASERRVFLIVAGIAAVAVAVLYTGLLGRILVRPLTRLAGAMSEVESGGTSVEVPETGRRDEIGVVARGLRSMLGRVSRFNDELRATVDEAVADLAQKNRELEEANQLLVEARRTLTAREQLAALGQLSGTIAHELGNPLNAINGHVQLLARSPTCPPDVREGLGIVHGEVARMTAIIRRFLDSARALSAEPQRVDVRALIDEALSLSLPVEARSRIDLTLDVARDLGPVRLDPLLVRHVLTNFVSNAVDAMPGGGSLTVRARRAGDQVAFSVSDSGRGITPDERKRIFEPFFTTKPGGKGTGLGLAISRELANAHRGRIEVESEPGAGATFTLVVPAPADGAAAVG